MIVLRIAKVKKTSKRIGQVQNCFLEYRTKHIKIIYMYVYGPKNQSVRTEFLIFIQHLYTKPVID